jgi:hypothetical protein
VATKADPPEDRHRIKVRLLVVAASVFAFLAIFTSWVDRQALDTDEWVDTSGRLLEDRVISDAVADYAVDELYANVDIAGLLEARLPDDLKGLSGPVAGGVRAGGSGLAKRALQTQRFQGLWKDANRRAHEQFVAILEDKSDRVTTENGEVTLDLRPLIEELADRIGVGDQVDERLPEDAGQLQVVKADQLDTAQKITKAVRGSAWFFSLGSIALFGLALYLYRGRRWMVMLGYGLGLIGAGLAAIALRSVAQGFVVDSLAQTEGARPAVEHAWTISTSLLDSIAKSVVAYGVAMAVVSFVASPADGAVSLRRVSAPTLRDRPGIVWGMFASAVFVFLLLWTPPGTRQLVLALVLTAFAAFGIEALRRKTAVEFPGAQRGDWMQQARHRARKASAEAGRRIGDAMKELTDDDRDPEDARLDRIERLGELRDKGLLTAAEFKAEKQKLLKG